MGEKSEFIFLMRHAAHRNGYLTARGYRGIGAVGGRFAEWLDGRGFALAIRHTDTGGRSTEVGRSATRLADATEAQLRALGGPRQATIGDVRPIPPAASAGEESDRVRLGAYRPDPVWVGYLLAWLKRHPRRMPPGSEPVLVGNDPLLSWLAAELTGGPVAIRRGELVCLRRRNKLLTGDGWEVQWTIGPDDESDRDRVLSKVQSKMDTAKVLGSVVTALLVFLLEGALTAEGSIYRWLGFASLGTSAALYFAALFLFDSLLMPDRFWGSRFRKGDPDPKWLKRLRYGRLGPERPPSSTAVVLQEAMVSIWNRFFRLATLWAALGIAWLTIEAARSSADPAFDPGVPEAALAAGWVVLIGLWIFANRPDVGSSD